MKTLWRTSLGGVMLYLISLTTAAACAWAGIGNPEAGKAQSVACAACHGQDGWNGLDPSYPNLAGQNENYLYDQLKQIQSNERNIALMAGQLMGKSDQDLWDLAAYYASLPRQVDPTEASAETLALGEQIYRGGILDKGVAACIACHGPNGEGNAQAGWPRVGGQRIEYVRKQLTAYREQQRGTSDGSSGMMWGVAAGLTDGEIDALAQYLKGLF